MINNSYDVNLNNAECIIKKDYVGYTEVINICTNEVIREIPWGFIDWLSGVGITSLVLLCFPVTINWLSKYFFPTSIFSIFIFPS